MVKVDWNMVVWAVMLFVGLVLTYNGILGLLSDDNDGLSTTSNTHPLTNVTFFTTLPTTTKVVSNKAHSSFTFPVRVRSTTTLSEVVTTFDVPSFQSFLSSSLGLSSTTTTTTLYVNCASPYSMTPRGKVFNHTKVAMCRLGYKDNNFTSYRGLGL